VNNKQAFDSGVVSWISLHGPFIRGVDAGFWFKITIAVLQVVFILIGWEIILGRWFIFEVYCGLDPGSLDRHHKESWGSLFLVEDFWTGHIADLLELHKTEELVREQAFDERVGKIIATEEIEIWSPQILLQCVFWMQYLVVFFSKLHGFLLQITFCNWFIRNIASNILSNHIQKINEDFSNY